MSRKLRARKTKSNGIRSGLIMSPLSRTGVRCGSGLSTGTGFTLIEIIVVLTLLGIIAVALTVTLLDDSRELTAEANMLKANIRYAQIRALSDTTPWQISFTSGSYNLSVPGATRSENLPEEGSSTHAFPAGISISAGGGTTVAFNSWGSPGASDITLTLTDGSDTRSIIITRETGYVP